MSVHIGIVIIHIGIVIIYIIPISRTLDDICTIHECNVIRAGSMGQKVDWRQTLDEGIMISVKSTLNPD